MLRLVRIDELGDRQFASLLHGAASAEDAPTARIISSACFRGLDISAYSGAC